MSIVLHGLGIGKGVAIGKAHIMVQQTLNQIPQYQINPDEISSEVARYEKAILSTRKDLEQIRKNIPDDAPTELGTFISFHLMMLSDVALSQIPIDIIEEQKINAEWALEIQLAKLSAQFDSIEDEYLRSRKQDVVQVIERVFNSLKGLYSDSQHDVDNLLDDIILVASDLSPANMIFFKNSRINGFLTDLGGVTSHTAILGRSLNIPAVIALRNAKEIIQEDEWIIIDASDGVIILDPDEIILNEYREKEKEYRKELRKLSRIKNTGAKTQDGTEVELLANVEDIRDISTANKNSADGIGLYRSEFFFLNKENIPSEQEQLEHYIKLIRKAAGKPLTIRTVDLREDKNPKWNKKLENINPAMGLTGIRLCLTEPVMFRTQIRAILQAGLVGPIRVLFPMITSLSELKQSLSHLETAKEQLEAVGIEYAENIPIGIMVETPSCALSISSMIKHIDFISIGTNDLVQYTLSVDRSNDTVSHLYQPTHPVVLSLINHTIKTAHRHNKHVSVCGEMAAEPIYTRLLLGMGLRSFSILPARILNIKQIILNSNIDQFDFLVQKMLRNDDPDKSDTLLNKINLYDKLNPL